MTETGKISKEGVLSSGLRGRPVETGAMYPVETPRQPLPLLRGMLPPAPAILSPSAQAPKPYHIPGVGHAVGTAPNPISRACSHGG